MKPSIGRIVHYTSYGTPGGEYGKECRAAIVTAVDEYQESSDDSFIGHVDLCVLNPTGMFFKQGLHEGVGSGTWHWPERV